MKIQPSQSRSRTRGIVLPILAFAFSLQSIAAAWSGDTGRRCQFVGQILELSEPSEVILIREGKVIKPGPNFPIKPDDRIRVTEQGHFVEIHDRPGEGRRRIYQKDGEIVIENEDACAIKPDISINLEKIQVIIDDVFDKPIPPEPVPTRPQRQFGTTATGGHAKLVGIRQSEQYLTADTSAASVVWRGAPATVTFLDQLGRPVSAKPSQTPYTYTSVDFSRRLRPGESIKLVLKSEGNTAVQDIRVTDLSALPSPSGFSFSEFSSEAEKTLYAAWLVLEGPEEWRLQGLSMLQLRSSNSYAAWRLWRSLVAGWIAF